MYFGYSSTALVIVFAIIYGPSLCETTSAHITPVAYNASLYQESPVRFHCVVQGVTNHKPVWYIDSLPTNTVEVENRGITVTNAQQSSNLPNSYESTLTIPSTPENNNTELLCLAQNIYGTSDFSDIALFRVQGRLNVPLNVNYESFNNSHYEVIWQAPNTIDVTDQPDILIHTVCITIEESAISNCKNVSETHYLILKLSLNVNITISSWNTVGEGENITIQLQPCSSKGYQDIQLVLHFEEKPLVEIQLLTNSTNCFNTYQLEISNMLELAYSSNMPVIPTVISSNDQENMTMLLIKTLQDLNGNSHFTALLIAVNMDKNESINFTTFDVQDVEFTPSYESIGVNCSFAKGTTAQGCHIILISNSETIAKNVTRQCNNASDDCLSAYTEITLAPDQYIASVFDLEYNGTIDHSNAAFTTTVDIPNSLLTSTGTVTTVLSSASAISSVITTTITNITQTKSHRETTIISAVCIFAGLFSTWIVVIALIIVYKKRHRKLNDAATEVIYEEPMATAFTPNMEPCLAYKHLSPKAKQHSHAEVIYDEPITPPEKRKFPLPSV